MSWEMKVPAAKSGEGGDYEIPEAGNHVAICIGLIDLGSHETTFQGNSTGYKRKVAVIWELANEKKKEGGPFILLREFTLSFHEKSALRDWLGKWFAKTIAEGQSVDLKAILGKSCLLTVLHKDTKDGSKTYAKVEGIGPVPKGMTVGKSLYPPLSWQIGQKSKDGGVVPPPEDEWIPYLYGEALADVIRKSPEFNGKPVPKAAGKIDKEEKAAEATQQKAEFEAAEQAAPF